MNSLELIGKVACNRLRHLLAKDSEEMGTARFVLHRLSSEEVAAIAVAVGRHSEFALRIDIQLPRYRMAGMSGVTAEMLSDLSTTELRHSKCSKYARLTALFDDSQEQSLAQVEKINKDLLLDPETASVWIDEVSEGLLRLRK